MLVDVSMPILIVIAIVVLYLLNSIKILREYERGVIFRLGRALPAPKTIRDIGPNWKSCNQFTLVT